MVHKCDDGQGASSAARRVALLLCVSLASLAGPFAMGAQAVTYVEYTPPETWLTSVPDVSTATTSATFVFGSPQRSVTEFQCSIDHTNFVPCVSPKSYGALSVGSHSFEVSAIDTIGRIDPTPATWLWTIAVPQSKATPKPLRCKQGFRKVKKKNGKTVCKRKPRKSPRRGQR